MALARKCTRCKKLYEHYPVGATRRYNSVQRKQYTQNDQFVDCQDKIDLCPECMSEFDKWMSEGEKNEKIC